MLQKIRNTVTGWLAVVIATLLIIPFAFWGINSYFGQGSAPVVVKINDKEINLQQYQRAFANYKQQMQAYLGQNLGLINDEALKKLTIDKLIESELLNQTTKTATLQISDDNVRNTIKNVDAFQGEKGFDKSFYELGIQRLGMPPRAYEEQLRKDMASEQLQSAIIESSFAFTEEAELLVHLENQKRDFYYSLLAVDDLKDSIEVTEEEINEYYSKHKQNYTEPEQVKIAYIELSLEELAEEVVVTDEELQDFYASNKQEYDVVDQRKFNQILVKTSDNTTETEIDEAKAKAEAIKELLGTGKTFKEIAEEQEPNAAPKLQISEYGFTNKGVMPAEVDTVMFGMKEGEISDIIKSKEGFHIVEVVSTRGGEENTFENTKSKVKNDYQLVQAEDRFFDLADQLATLAFEHFDTLEIASEAIDIPVQESDFFTQEGDDQGITSNKKIISSSFSDDILHKQQNSELIELSDNHLAVIRVVEHKPSTVKPIEAIKDQIISDIRFLEASRQQKELGKKILGQLNADTKYDQIEMERDIKWEYAESITRKDVSIRRAILRTAFRMGRPQENEQLYAGTSLGTGDYVVIVLDKVEDPDSVDEKEIENAKIKIQNLRASSDWNGFTEELENQANIVIFSDNI